MLDEVPVCPSSSESESDNSSRDKPFYSEISSHLLAHDGSYKFLCQDEDGTARVWCDYGPAVINVGRKTMHQYIRQHSLEKERYQPIADKPQMKSNTRKTANRKQLRAHQEIKLIKVLKSKKTNDGTMYKVERSDSSKCWLKLDKLYDYPHLIEAFIQETKDQEGKQNQNHHKGKKRNRTKVTRTET